MGLGNDRCGLGEMSNIRDMRAFLVLLAMKTYRRSLATRNDPATSDG